MDRMAWTLRVLLALSGLMLLLRTALYLVYVAFRLRNPLENFFLEAQMGHLAWRVQAGLSLYPDWHEYPHVANVFGPIYFWLVGLFGWWTQADLDVLLQLGRLVSFLAGLGASLLVGRLLTPYGRTAALIGVLSAASAAPVFGFSVMVRSDMLAELLGFGGFALAVGRTRGGLVAAIVLSALAPLTRQPTAVFVLAAAASLVWSGRRIRAALLLSGAAALLLVLVGAISAFEPNFLAGLFTERRTPFSFPQWSAITGRLLQRSPDIVLLSLLGAALWMRNALRTDSVREERDRSRAFLVLMVVVWAAGLATCGKVGSDLNYFLSLRLTAGLAAGCLRHAAARQKSRLAAVAGATVVCAAFLFSLRTSLTESLVALRDAAADSGAAVQRHAVEQCRRIAAQRSASLLTDSGLLAYYQRERAAFADPFLFRLLVQTGRLDPRRIRDRLAAEDYQFLFTTADIGSAAYDDYPFGLPPSLAALARRHYHLQGQIGGLFVYLPNVTTKSGEIIH